MRRKGTKELTFHIECLSLISQSCADYFTDIVFWDEDHTLQMPGSGRFSALFKVTQLICGRVLSQVMPSQLPLVFALPHGGSFCPHLSGITISHLAISSRRGSPHLSPIHSHTNPTLKAQTLSNKTLLNLIASELRISIQ